MDFLVLSSSRGTTFQAVIDRVKDGSLTARFLGLIADREDRGCVQKAKAANVPIYIIERQEGEAREAYDRRLDQLIETILSNNNGDRKQTVLAAIGWMFIFSPWFVNAWRGKILNVHPSLLPKYPGGNAFHDALASGENESGMTIHIIDEGVDTGPIIVQKKCSILPNDTEASLKERIQTLEKEWYPKVLQSIEQGEIKL
jgi:phosphoribosylglycinamide formyltransferase-1